MDKPTGFARRGFYLHACWEFEYPFAVKRWRRGDYQRMFELLRRMGMTTVMMWPTLEAAPAPLSDDDAADIRRFRDTVADAQAAGLEAWVTLCANVMAKPEIRSRPLFQRHLYPYRIDVRLDDPAQRKAFLQHRESLLAILNNADGYVTIDGDPGSYPNADPREFLGVFLADREILSRVGTHPHRQKLIPWIWSGWGGDWAKHGPWQEPLEPLVRPVMKLLRQHMPDPWAMLPGRSFTETHANGRVNLDLAEQEGLIDRSMLMLYEIIEFEPTPPAVVIQFDAIRRVLRQEAKYAGQAQGVMGNAQQPVMAIPNLFFFARGATDLSYLDRTDDEVLRDLADFLGGPAELLIPAWSCLSREWADLPAELPDQLRDAKLKAAQAELIPGGEANYRHILADFVTARRFALLATQAPADGSPACLDAAADAVAHIVRWWNRHRYVYDGNAGDGFAWRHVHGGLRQTCMDWARTIPGDREAVAAAIARRLAHDQVLPGDAPRIARQLLSGTL
ncbi:MAG: hypothetical protein IT440_01160 [Phycisphaeraceae bacterium]|nr:hypothetical protein [Phycisphaeraceae bacterium]